MQHISANGSARNFAANGTRTTKAEFFGPTDGYFKRMGRQHQETTETVMQKRNVGGSGQIFAMGATVGYRIWTDTEYSDAKVKNLLYYPRN